MHSPVRSNRSVKRWQRSWSTKTVPVISRIWFKRLSLKGLGKRSRKTTSSIYPLQNVYLQGQDLGKRMEVHGDYSDDVGVKVDRPAEEAEAQPEAEIIGT